MASRWVLVHARVDQVPGAGDEVVEARAAWPSAGRRGATPRRTRRRRGGSRPQALHPAPARAARVGSNRGLSEMPKPPYAGEQARRPSRRGPCPAQTGASSAPACRPRRSRTRACTSYDERSNGDSSASAVRRGAASSPARHQTRGWVNDWTRSRPPRARRAHQGSRSRTPAGRRSGRGCRRRRRRRAGRTGRRRYRAATAGTPSRRGSRSSPPPPGRRSAPPATVHPVCEREPKHLAARRARAREQIERIAAERRSHALVRDARRPATSRRRAAGEGRPATRRRRPSASGRSSSARQARRRDSARRSSGRPAGQAGRGGRGRAARR